MRLQRVGHNWTTERAHTHTPHTHTHNWFILVYSRKEHNIVNKLYSNKLSKNIYKFNNDIGYGCEQLNPFIVFFFFFHLSLLINVLRLYIIFPKIPWALSLLLCHTVGTCVLTVSVPSAGSAQDMRFRTWGGEVCTQGLQIRVVDKGDFRLFRSCWFRFEKLHKYFV